MPLRPLLKPLPALLLSTLLPCLMQPARAADHVRVHIHCKPSSADCPRPPEPPQPPPPPRPPRAPQAPAMDTEESGTPPPLPALPALPAPPAPPPVPPVPPQPKIPAVPAAAHAACAGKAAGASLTWNLGPGETMGGVCAKRGDKMVFDLRSYDLER